MAERDAISQFTATLAAARGASFIRTHDVRMARQFLEVGRAMGLAFPAAG
jgi:dihydropteroate synthase